MMFDFLGKTPNATYRGFVRTGMRKRARGGLGGQAARERARTSNRGPHLDTSSGQVGVPEDIAAPVVPLASGGARFMAGHGIDLTGGVCTR